MLLLASTGVDCTTHQPLNASFQCTIPPPKYITTANGTVMQPACDPSKPQPMSAQGSALLAWRDSFHNNSALSSWGNGDPCTMGWTRVECDTSGLVMGLHLRGMAGSLTAYGPNEIKWQALTELASLRFLELEVRSAIESAVQTATHGNRSAGPLNIIALQDGANVSGCACADAQCMHCSVAHSLKLCQQGTLSMFSNSWNPC